MASSFIARQAFMCFVKWVVNARSTVSTTSIQIQVSQSTIDYNTHLHVPLQTSAYFHLLIPTNHSRMFIPFLFQLQPLVAHMNQGTIVSMMDHWVRSERLPRAMPPRHAGVVRDASTCARCPGHQRWRNGHLQENEITKWAVLSFLELVDWKKCVCFSVKGHEWDTTMGIYWYVWYMYTILFYSVHIWLHTNYIQLKNWQVEKECMVEISASPNVGEW